MNNIISKSNNSDKQQYSLKRRRRPSILLGIIIAIIIGTIVGGWFPDFAVRFNILGEVFLNSLMMIVVPIVMLSLIIGITISLFNHLNILMIIPYYFLEPPAGFEPATYALRKRCSTD